jgi:hypothetical protein
MLDWLRTEFWIEKRCQNLQDMATLDVDGLTAETEKVRGTRKPL